MILRHVIYASVDDDITIAAEQNTARLTYGNLTLIFSKKVGDVTDTFKINIPEFQLEEFKNFLRKVDNSHRSILVDRRVTSKDGPFIQFDIHELVKKNSMSPLPVELGLAGRDYEVNIRLDDFDAELLISNLDGFIAERDEIMGEE